MHSKTKTSKSECLVVLVTITSSLKSRANKQRYVTYLYMFMRYSTRSDIQMPNGIWRSHEQHNTKNVCYDDDQDEQLLNSTTVQQ